jgi:hypothetical protein
MPETDEDYQDKGIRVKHRELSILRFCVKHGKSHYLCCWAEGCLEFGPVVELSKVNTPKHKKRRIARKSERLQKQGRHNEHLAPTKH